MRSSISFVLASSFSGFSLAQDSSVQTYADIGFGVGSDIGRQLMGVVQYDLDSRWSLTRGWRHLDIDYDHTGFAFDAAMDRPIFGAIYRFLGDF